jgi:hypothetical protein
LKIRHDELAAAANGGLAGKRVQVHSTGDPLLDGQRGVVEPISSSSTPEGYYGVRLDGPGRKQLVSVHASCLREHQTQVDAVSVGKATSACQAAVAATLAQNHEGAIALLKVRTLLL